MIGICKRRMWGLQMAIFVCVSTIIVSPVLLPLTGSEMIIDGAVIFLLLLARFGSRRLGEEAAEAQDKPPVIPVSSIPSLHRQEDRRS